MSTARTIAKNTTVLFIAQMVTYLMGFFITMYTARYLGAGGLGTLSIALSLAGIFVVFTDLGLGTLITRELSREKSLKNKFISNAIVIKFILSFLTFGLIALYTYILGYQSPMNDVIYIISIAIILNGFSGMFYAVFQAYEEMKFQSVTTILNSSLMLPGTLIAIYLNLGIIAIAYVYFISNSVNFIYILALYIRKHSLPGVEIDLNFWKPTIKEVLPLSITSIFAMLIFRVDTVILSILSSTAAVGWYNAAYRLMEALIFFPAVYTASIFPFLSSSYTSSRAPIKGAYEKSFKYLIIMSLPIAVGTTFLSDQIILLIYKSAFAESILTLQILIWVLPFTFLNYILGSLLTSMNKQYTVLKITIICLIINISLNIILISYFSYLGAAFVTVLTDAISVVLSYYVVSGLISKIKFQNILFKPIIACAFMGSFLFIIKLNLFISIFIAVIIYFGVLFAFKTFDNDDYSLFKQILNKE